MCGLNKKAHGVTAVGAVGQTTTVLRYGAFDIEWTELVCAAGVHGMCMRDAFVVEPFVNFVGTNYKGAGAKRYLFQVGNMIGMSVRYENIIGLDGIDIDLRGEWIAADEGVY